MHKAHETIWLQVDPDGESYDPEQWGLEDDATWCKDQINANDVKYVRTDIAEAELEAARADAKEAWEKLGEQCIAHTATIQKLAAEQAKNVGLREALHMFMLPIPHKDETALSVCKAVSARAEEALSTPSDTSALEAIVKKAGEVMRERCVEYCETRHTELLEPEIREVVEVIRDLPAVTPEDLNDDGVEEHYRLIAYFTEEPEEGAIGLGDALPAVQEPQINLEGYREAGSSLAGDDGRAWSED